MTEAETLQVRDRHERLRRHGYSQLIEHLDHKSGLRPGLDLGAATNLLLSFGSPSQYRTFVID